MGINGREEKQKRRGGFYDIDDGTDVFLFLIVFRFFFPN